MSEKMSANTNAINWFEISVSNIERATKFYEAILDIKMYQMEMMDTKMAMFPTGPESGKLGGALAESNMHHPSDKGVLVYLNANPDLQIVLDKVAAAGGKVNLPKTSIGGNGFMAFISDTEGNTIGLHSGM